MSSHDSIKGRGTAYNPLIRFDRLTREAVVPDWPGDIDDPPPLPTELIWQDAKSAITRNNSPDIYFSQSINPYHGCEHGCIYCYARPSHAYWGYSPGLDFETKIVARRGLPERLRVELARPGYQCEPICLGSNTDCYQPLERKLGLTRSVIEVLLAHRHPLVIITKNALVERDLDLLKPLAEQQLVQVYISLCTLEADVARVLEPRASAPHRRLQAVRNLSQAGIPVGVLCSPVIPALTDHQIETVVSAAAEAGAGMASYIILRLPLEINELFKDWLARHFPQRAEHVMSLIRQMRGGQENVSRFGERMRGTGIFAQLLRNRFELACRRNSLGRRRLDLDVSNFHVPGHGTQLDLFE
ncbi:PA0069 family radical SAM protein [Chitinivorax sp. B]|uniref:PA0069 family radical SAM protein n=1 Tax=Chitinivorax sp. B TaxID=2502235 RepID=UPI0010F98809|nr:PA0069 family radical SAM protein [Chitinivorax sp. B]